MILSLFEQVRHQLRLDARGRLAWAGFLAIASDLQLIPRLMGIDALQAAVEQVSVMPHRVEKDAGLVSRYFI